MVIVLLLLALATLFASWRAWRRLRYSLHMFQLHGYKLSAFAAWLAARPVNFVIRPSHAIGVLLLGGAVALTGMMSDVLLSSLLLASWCVAFASSRRYRSDREKKPLAYTYRLRRLLGVSAACAVIAVALGAWLGYRSALLWPAWPVLAGLLLADFGAPLWVLLAALILEPLEYSFRVGFKQRARQKLRNHRNLHVIAITGSFGKTTVKFVLAEILSHRFNVLATPASYNTPMGICKVVNDMLQPEHQLLIVEMGARYAGDIGELCDLVSPTTGVITAVGAAHLESMESLDAIEFEKGTLAERIPPDGLVVLNVDDERVARMDQRTRAHIMRVSASDTGADVTARDIRFGPEGTAFDVVLASGETSHFSCALLGRHNVTNILLGTAIGLSFGLRLRQISHAVRRVKPVEHRLQLRQEGPITVIDDAFNSNPVGARNAVEILGQFDTGRRVIVTPGMVELGAVEEEENRRFGQSIADNVDLALLVGRTRTRPIVDGLRSRDFPEEHIRVFASLFEARDFLQGYLEPGDVVLYENDLPDHYDEAA